MESRWDTGRTEAFSDGVFAIAITLLVLDINVPESGFENLPRAILHEWPAYVGATALGLLLPRVAAAGYLAIAVLSILRARGDAGEPAQARAVREEAP